MLKIVFFASIREQLAHSELHFATTRTVDALIDALVAQYGERWREVLRAPNVIVAVNQQVADTQHRLRDGDEVAFFPPVSGG